MSQKAAITVHRAGDEVPRLWSASPFSKRAADADATVSFKKAPGDRGTEIHVELSKAAPAGKVGVLVEKVAGTLPLAKIKDDLRRFKQQVETGEVPRSDSTPEGESVERKFDQRPAQPLQDAEREKAGV